MVRKASSPPPNEKNKSPVPKPGYDADGKKIKKKKRFVPKRPVKCTEEQVEQAIFKTHGGVYATAKELDINVATLYEYLKRWPRLKKCFKRAKKVALDDIEKRLVDMAIAGDMRAIRFYLNSQGKDRGYGKKEIEVTNKNINIPAPTVIQLTEEAKRELLNRVRLTTGQPPLPLDVPLQEGIQQLGGEFPPPVSKLPPKVIEHKPDIAKPESKPEEKKEEQHGD